MLRQRGKHEPRIEDQQDQETEGQIHPAAPNPPHRLLHNANQHRLAERTAQPFGRWSNPKSLGLEQQHGVQVAILRPRTESPRQWVDSSPARTERDPSRLRPKASGPGSLPAGPRQTTSASCSLLWILPCPGPASGLTDSRRRSGR